MTGLDRIRETVRVIEACLDASDWETLAAIDAGTATSDVDATDAEALAAMLDEVQQLQHRVEVAMSVTRDELGDYPRMRRAARAYGGLPIER